MRPVVPLSLLFCMSTAVAADDERSYPRTVLEDSPLAYWRFEEAGVHEKAANLGSQETALDGAYVDVTLTDESATASLGKAAVFDRPTSRIELAGKISPWLNGTASLEFWIKTTQRGEGSWNAPAVFGADSNGDGNDLFWGTNYHGRVGVRRGDSGPAALTPEPINDNHWHHVVLTRDHERGVMKAYLDGRLADTFHDAREIPIKTTYATIGLVESLPGEGQKLMATLDEIAVYDYALSPRQVKRHWKAASRRGRVARFDVAPPPGRSQTVCRWSGRSTPSTRFAHLLIVAYPPVAGACHAGVPNQSCISFSKGATTSGGSGHSPRSPVSVIHVSSAARSRIRAARCAGSSESARLRISWGSVRVS